MNVKRESSVDCKVLPGKLLPANPNFSPISIKTHNNRYSEGKKIFQDAAFGNINKRIGHPHEAPMRSGENDALCK